MTVNIPLLRKGVEWVEEQADKPLIDREWHQGAWVMNPQRRAYQMLRLEPLDVVIMAGKQVAAHCGTAFCLAGYIGQLVEPGYATSEEYGGVHVSTRAAHELGLPTQNALGHTIQPANQPLFAAGNSAADIRRIAEELAGEPL